ncbi:hypothetical protein [Helicobacter apodemus]|uniref:Uncharacterized protein n=1 Tax=Helicobacter apodemus TaxID=135569 RepID=A0A2U8FD42_9HELI|nr:hypothetical protein [Helicobacter apodemus]AWI34139.1 hypothetical protein CDV25_04695 [Helicobacter apodemus]
MKNESNNFSLIPNLPSSTLFLSLSVISVLNTTPLSAAQSWTQQGTINISNSGTNNKMVG